MSDLQILPRNAGHYLQVKKFSVVLDVCLFHQKVIHILPNLKEIYYQIGFGLVICFLSYTYATNMPRISSTT